MKTLQIQANDYDNNRILKAVGIKRIHAGWYTVTYNGVNLDASTITGAKRNRNGFIRQVPPAQRY